MVLMLVMYVLVCWNLDCDGVFCGGGFRCCLLLLFTLVLGDEVIEGTLSCRRIACGGTRGTCNQKFQIIIYVTLFFAVSALILPGAIFLCCWCVPVVAAAAAALMTCCWCWKAVGETC